METINQEENQNTQIEEEKRARRSSVSSNSSASDDSSDRSSDKDQKENAPPKRGPSSSKSAHKNSKSKSASKEKQRSLSRSASPDGSDSNRRERAKKYRNDEKFESKSHQQYRGGYQKPRDRDSRSRSRSPSDRRFGHDKKKTIIFKPTLEGHLYSFRQFMEAQKFEIDPSKAEKIYQKYKAEYEDKQNQIFFAEHRNDEWFREKYDPILSEKLKEEMRAESRVNAETFFRELKDNAFDAINFNYEDYEHKAAANEETSKSNTEQIEEEKENPRSFSNFTEVRLDASLDITGAPFFGFDPNSQTLFVKSIPKMISRWDLTEAFEKLTGFVSLSLSEPFKSQEFIRYGWILFDTEANCNKAFEYLKTLNIKGYAFNVVKSRSQTKSVKICENVDKERILVDLDLSKQLVEALDEEKDIRGNPILKNANTDDPAKQLDLQILYLRKVHAYCFYCATEYNDERMLTAKCGPAHLRRNKLNKEEPTPDLPDWHRRIADLVTSRIQESSRKPKRTLEDIQKAAEDEFDAELRAKCEKVSIKHGNWPCKYCHKIFKEDHFVIKHIKTKHQEKYDKIRETKMFENYKNDKHKITVSASSYQSGRNYNRSQNQQGGYRKHNDNRRGGYHGGPRPNRNFEYRDLDDPKVTQIKQNRAVVDYGDL